MLEVLRGEFFWGIVVGLVLSFVGGWVLAKVTISAQREMNKRTITRLCADTIRNIRKFADEMDYMRDKAKTINHEFLALIDVELQVFGRNREGLVLLPDDEREQLRRVMSDIAVKRVEVGNNLEVFYERRRLADQVQAEGRPPEAERIRHNAEEPLKQAHDAAVRLIEISKNATSLEERLNRLR